MSKSRKRKHFFRYTIEEIDSSELVIVDDYQKPLDDKRAAKIASNYDPNIANEPKVSYRNGKYYLFDGQHTVAALILRNGNKHLKITCKVYHDLTVEEEAILFAEQTGYSAKPTPGYRLRALLFAKDKEAEEFKAVTESVGFKLELEGVREKDHIKCINTALRMYRKLGKELYADALAAIHAAWDGEPDSLRGDVIIGVCEFVRLYHGKYNHRLLSDALAEYHPYDLCCAMLSDFVRKGYKRNVYPIYTIYNSNCGPRKLEMCF